MLKKFPSDKINGTKNVFFFSSIVSSNSSCTFNLRFLCELRRKVRLHKALCRTFHYRFRFVFIKGYIFSTKCMDSLTLKRHKFEPYDNLKKYKMKDNPMRDNSFS